MSTLKIIKKLSIVLIIHLLIILSILPAKVIANSETQSIIKDLVNNQISSTINTVNQENVNNKPLSLYPVGSIYISTNSTNPSKLIGGTWEAYGQGRVLVGVGTNGGYTFTAGSTGTTVGATTNPLGEYTHTLTTNEMASHMHTATASGSVTSTFTGETVTTSSSGEHTHTASATSSSDGSHSHSINAINAPIRIDDAYLYWVKGRGSSSGNAAGPYSGSQRPLYIEIPAHNTNSSGSHTHDVSGTAASTGAHTHTLTPKGTVVSTFTGSSVTSSLVGGSKAHNNMQAYVVTYMWKRVA